MRNKINPKQENAIDLVLSGMADGEIAERVGAARQTISRWRNQDMDFILALQTRRAQMRDKHMDAMSELVEESIRVVAKAIFYGDETTKLKTAKYVLRLSGLRAHAKPGKALTKGELEKEGFISIFEEAVREIQIEKGF